MYCVITYEEGFCKRDENKYGDLLDIWQQDEWSFRIIEDQRECSDRGGYG